MGSLEAESRLTRRDHLPSLNVAFKDAAGYPQKNLFTAPVAGVPLTPLISPKSTMYPGQYPYPTPTTTSGSAGPTQAGYFSLVDHHRAMDDKEKQLQTQQPPRQSLPSIHEALGSENTLSLYPGAPTFGQQSQSTHHATPPSLSSNLAARANGEGLPGPPNPFSGTSSAGSLLREPSFSQPGPLPADVSRSSLTSVSSQGSRNASLNSPTQSARTGITSIAGSQTSAYEYGPRTSASSAASTSGYGPFSQSFSFQPQQAPAYPLANYETRPYAGGPWKPGAADQASRPGDLKGEVTGVAGQPHSDSAKRPLDAYDVEAPLSEISDISTRTLDFSRHYANRVHQSQRSGSVAGALPSLNEIEEMLHLQRRNQEALLRLRAAVVNQEHALAEQRMAQTKVLKPTGPDDGHMMVYQEEYKGSSGGFAGPESKKRRGKAAPPGRCHSCNREETPEWRRGPDGARTLCNACGLHYAKLTRKMGADKASFLVSNLRPKETIDTPSPRSQ